MKIFIIFFPYLALFKILFYEAFTSTNFITSEGWTLRNQFGIYSDCGGERLLGGYNNFGVGAQAMILLQLPPHYQIDISFKFWRIDSWDGENFYVYIDQTLSFQQNYQVDNGTNSCGTGWEDAYHIITINQSHGYQSVFILLTSNLDYHPFDESWGFRDFYLYLHLCPAGCTHCQENDQMWECIPWILLNSAFLSVTSVGFNDEGWTITGGTQSTSQCANVPLYGGYGLTGQLSEIKQTYCLPFHVVLMIKFRIVFIDTWSYEYAQLYVDGKLEYQRMQISNATVSYKNKCGLGANDQFSTSTILFYHSAETVSLVFTSNLNYPPDLEYFGIRDIQIFTIQISNCGNSITELKELCDDGNIYPFDGCFNCEYSCVEGCSNCIEGTCWECIQGWQFETLNNNCLPISQDEQIVSNENCDGIMNFEIYKNGQFICPMNCFECEFGICKKCQNNYILEENKCQPICQGLVYVNDFQCQDSNLQAFDQCHQCYDDIQQGCVEFSNGICIQCQSCWNFDFQLRKCIPISGYNKINGDEQCSQCISGQCFDCIMGWKFINFRCETVCGDGIVAGEEDCDDQNDEKSDGCHNCQYLCPQNCQVCEYGICKLCDDGYDLIIGMNICETKCGDGLILDDEECDDNNNQDGDGCSQFCKMEQNYVCKNSQFSFSQCTYSRQPEFQMKFKQEKNLKQYVQLYFSEKVKTINNIIYSQTIDFVIIDIDPSLYSINIIVIQEALEDVQNVEYLVEIQFFQSMDLIPQLSATLQYSLYNIYDSELVNYHCIVNLNKPKYIDDQKQRIADILQNFNKYMSNSIGGVGFMAILLGNLLLFGNILEILQYQLYLKFINVDYPLNLLVYFESSNIFSLQRFLDYFKFSKLLSFLIGGETYVESKAKLKFYEINADLFTNIQGQIFQIILLIISYILSFFLIQIIKCLNFIVFISDCKIISQILDFIQWSCQKYIRSYNIKMLKMLLRGNSWDILFTIFLQIKSQQNNKFRQNLENFIAFIFLYLTILIINKLVHKNQFSLNSFLLFWKSKHDLFTTLKKISFICVIVLFQDDQALQTILLSIICQFYLIYIIIFKPAKNKFENLNLFMMELSTLIFTFTSIFYWQIMQDYIVYEKQIILGWFHIGILLLVLFINLIYQVKQISIQIYRKVIPLICKQNINKQLVKDPYPLKNNEQQLNIFPIQRRMV